MCTDEFVGYVVCGKCLCGLSFKSLGVLEHFWPEASCDSFQKITFSIFSPDGSCSRLAAFAHWLGYQLFWYLLGAFLNALCFNIFNICLVLLCDLLCVFLDNLLPTATPFFPSKLCMKIGHHFAP